MPHSTHVLALLEHQGMTLQRQCGLQGSRLLRSLLRPRHVARTHRLTLRTLPPSRSRAHQRM